MEHIIPVKVDNYNKAILLLYNFKLKLSKMELNILTCILDHNMKTIDVYSRETIRKKLDKGKYTTNNYILKLRDKGILITKPADKNLYVNPEMYELVKDNKINFEFKLID